MMGVFVLVVTALLAPFAALTWLLLRYKDALNVQREALAMLWSRHERHCARAEHDGNWTRAKAENRADQVPPDVPAFLTGLLHGGFRDKKLTG